MKRLCGELFATGVALGCLLNAQTGGAADLGVVDIEAFETTTFELTNPDWPGNPYDVEATAVFKHDDTGEVIRTGLYFAGDNHWRFRFNGSRPGRWTLATESSDPDLRGATGVVTVRANPASRGFLTSHGTWYARQLGAADKLRVVPFLVYMNRRSEDLGLNPGTGDFKNLAGQWGGEANAARRAAYYRQAQENGASAIWISVNNQWFKNGALAWDDHSSVNPDPRVFAAIEDIVVGAFAEGLHVHIWAWGDNSRHRKLTPVGVPGGVNGPADRRVQRYLAARLGPLPGWSMGYGFDLFEWTNQQQVSDWANYLTGRMGWDHLLSARGLPLLGPDGREQSAPANFLDGYASLRRRGQLLQTDSNAVSRVDDGGPDSYGETLEDVRSDPHRPILYEERHGYQRFWQKDPKRRWTKPWPTTDMDGTRRLLWWWTMAGGAGGWIGFYPQESTSSADGPYPAAEQLRTHAAFWNKRLDLDMAVDNRLTGGIKRKQYALRSPATGRIVIFGEEADVVLLNLEDLATDYRGTLVDAEAEYAELDLGTIGASDPGIDLARFGRPRDWAVDLVPVAAASR